MAFNFPASPSNGDIYNSDGYQFKYDSALSAWQVYGATGVSPVFMGTRPTNPLQGQLFYDPVTDTLEVYDNSASAWEIVTSGNDYMGMTGGIAPSVRADGSALKVGDTFIDSSVSAKNVESYFWTGSVWQSSSNTTIEGTGSPTGLTNRYSGVALVENDLYIDKSTGDLYRWDSAAWQQLATSSGSSTDYMGMTGEGAPSVRANGSALQVGDTFIDNSVFAKNVESYWWTGSAWLSSSSVTMEGSGAPTLTNRFTGASLVENDLYIDETAGTLYRYDGSAWQELGSGSNTGFMVLLGEGYPTVRQDGSALVSGDIFITTSADVKDTEVYYWSSNAWKSANTVIKSAAGAPLVTGRSTMGALVENDLYINETTGDLYRWDSAAWQQLASGGGGVYYQSFITTEGSPTTRPDGTSFLVGDILVDNNTTAGDVYEAYVVSSIGPEVYTAMAPSISSGAGAPTSLSGRYAGAKHENDLYIDESAGNIYRYDYQTLSWVQVGGGGGGTVAVATPQSTGTVLGYTYDPATSLPNGTTFLGYDAGNTTLTGYGNTIIGSGTGDKLVSGGQNTVVGFSSGTELDNGFGNVCVGSNSFEAETSGSTNIAIGSFVLNGNNNNATIAIGRNSGRNINSGYENIFLGSNAGRSIGSGNSNLFIGTNSGQSMTGSSITIIGSYQDSTAVADGTLILARNNSTGDDLVRLRINENNAYGVPTATTGITVDYGTAGQVLTSQGTGGPPTWAAASGGTDYMGMISEGAPITRSDGSALLTGDHYFEGKEHYYYTAFNTSWNPANQVVRVGSSAPGGNFRISGQAAVTGDLYVNTTDNSLGYFNGSSWTAISGGGSGGSYYMGMTGEGGPGTRPDGSTLVVGDHFVDNSVFAKNVENYWWSGSAWLSSSNVIMEGPGAPSSTARFTGAALVENDFYVDETNAALYRWDSSAWQLLGGGGGGGGVTTDAQFNTSAGTNSLTSLTTGILNAAFGGSTLNSNTTGAFNAAFGSYALFQNVSGAQNTAVGTEALAGNTGGNENTCIGNRALAENTTGGNNTAVGAEALSANQTGNNNTAIGKRSGNYINGGEANTALGQEALPENITGSYNTAAGYKSLFRSTASHNIGIGYNAGSTITTGGGNICIGATKHDGSDLPIYSITTESNIIAMGHRGITDAYIQAAWTVVSDARDKMNFAPVPHGLDFVNQLEPTAYQFRVDRDTETPNGGVRYGFKAQDILALEGDNSVIVNAKDPDHLKYTGENLVPVLVNAVQELTSMVKDLQSEVAALKGE